ncbi:MAG: IS3 family transposase [Myxococcales bacterium]|nr:IS3 family transposase [Myxococcales bacterium]
MASIDEAVAAGVSRRRACEEIGLPVRTEQRWRRFSGGDRRRGPKSRPHNALTDAERKKALTLCNAPEHAGLSPKQIVPKLADQGIYVASESTLYRLLREAEQIQPRRAAAPRIVRAKPSQQADGPNQLWSWDITFLRTAVRGSFYRLYLMIDVWSRKIVGWAVHSTESAQHAAQLAELAVEIEEAQPGLVLHMDNGGAMRGRTMLATLQWLGVVPSFSRPHVKDDNAYSEALFRTLKYRPAYPKRPFASLAEARRWVADFVRWYNHEHLHSCINYVTPAQRHAGEHIEVLRRRRLVYQRARSRRPERWQSKTRDWTPVGVVKLNEETLARTQ